MKLATTPVAVNLLQFGKRIRSSAPMGFQSDIEGVNPDNVNYSPMWRIHTCILENIHDVAAKQPIGHYSCARFGWKTCS
jgi:hypothetical protein